MAEVSVNGVGLHVQRLGDGPADVVFAHGLVMDNLSSWYFTVANPVAQLRGVRLYDLRGHGRSARPTQGYDLDTLVDELVGLLDAEGIEQAHLVGNSFGGLLAVACALRYPERVRGLVLVDALLPRKGWGEAMVGTLATTGEERDATIERVFASWLGRHSSRKRNRLAKQAGALVEGTTLLEDLRASTSWPDEAFAALSLPILAIYGAESDVLGDGQLLADAGENVVFDVFDGCSHSVIWEATAQVRDRIVRWFGEI
ncbi:MAG: alpha/beta hydrolase [Proteobacteria bacterium]|nr:alpha/beta hydrolase [Pseudomonadota bacterium]